MSTRLRSVAAAISFSLLFFAGCAKSSNGNPVTNQSQAPTQPAGAPQIVSAKTALWPMETAAHQWARDAVILRMTAKELPGFKNEEGKAALWEAAFGSPSLHEYRLYTYAIANAPPNIYKGIVGGLEMPWGGVTRDAMAVELSEFNVDSDAAYKAASGEAADWLKKNPSTELASLEVGDTFKYREPVWYLTWGTKKSGYMALVDANTGAVLKK